VIINSEFGRFTGEKGSKGIDHKMSALYCHLDGLGKGGFFDIKARDFHAPDLEAC